MALSKKSRGSVSLVCRPHAYRANTGRSSGVPSSKQAKAPAVSAGLILGLDGGYVRSTSDRPPTGIRDM
jgi:hypothetical protein